MQTLFGGGERRVERGLVPFAELLFLLAFFAAAMYWFTLYGSPPLAAGCVGAGLALVLFFGYLRVWRSGGCWEWETRVKPGPFPWPAFRKENILGAALMASLAAARLPVSIIEIVAAFLFARDALWVGRWLRANSREGPRNPEDQARG